MTSNELRAKIEALGSRNQRWVRRADVLALIPTEAPASAEAEVVRLTAERDALRMTINAMQDKATCITVGNILSAKSAGDLYGWCERLRACLDGYRPPHTTGDS